jgi:molybdate transport system ATP-binding protein
VPALPLLSLENLVSKHLSIDHWEIHAGSCWAILGRNGCGKQYLGQLLTGDQLPVSGLLQHRFNSIELLSFELQQALYEKQIREDDSEFSEQPDSGATVRELLALGDSIPEVVQILGLEPLLDRGYRLLSSGEARKTLLASALLRNPDLLILDEPFDSLDRETRAHLADYFGRIATAEAPVLLFLFNTIEDLYPWHTHIAVMDRGSLIIQGTATELMERDELQALLQFDASSLPPWPEPLHANRPASPLVNLCGGKVSYGGKVIFDNLDLHLEAGTHTLLTGPNGSGKSTLLALISGDHPQCYGNDLHIFGKRRGSGETIWELKKHIGIVSPGLHRDHRVPGSALHIVLSGFFDSIGLYEAPTAQQVSHARCWLELVGLGNRSEIPFKQLSYGEQRLVLIARALVKQPALLLLDEPTQGLDDINRHRVLFFLEHLASQQQSTIVMASHREDEFLPLFGCHVEMEKFRPE